jgi:hypothetical protein
MNAKTFYTNNFWGKARSYVASRTPSRTPSCTLSRTPSRAYLSQILSCTLSFTLPHSPSLIPHYPALSRIVLHSPALSCTLLHFPALSRTLSHTEWMGEVVVKVKSKTFVHAGPPYLLTQERPLLWGWVTRPHTLFVHLPDQANTIICVVCLLGSLWVSPLPA